MNANVLYDQTQGTGAVFFLTLRISLLPLLIPVLYMIVVFDISLSIFLIF